MTIIARRYWRGDKKAEVDISEVLTVRWSNVSGWSYRVYHPGVALYGYIDYDLAVKLGLSTGSHYDRAHSVKVIFHKCDNAKKTYSDAYHLLASKASQIPKYF